MQDLYEHLYDIVVNWDAIIFRNSILPEVLSASITSRINHS